MTRSITTRSQAASCYFRTSVEHPHRKAIVQIEERCNLHCVHCFVSATQRGSSMTLADIREKVVPRLSDCRVQRVTLTGGEPTIHPNFLEVVSAFRDGKMSVGICTNGTMLTAGEIDQLTSLGGVHVNVSLDGFRPDSHGVFRGDRDSFRQTIETVRQLSRAGLLQGLLCTPNNLAEVDEYRELCEFAVSQGADYVLMNPLGSMGRGARSQARFASPSDRMRAIHECTATFASNGLDVVHIRFPNDSGVPLAGCEAGTIIYVFAPGDLTVCPYLVFAAKTPQSRHAPEEFIVGNILTDADIAKRLDAYSFHDRYQVGNNATCRSCTMGSECGKGCPAAVVSAGHRIGALDAEVCPIGNNGSLIQIQSA